MKYLLIGIAMLLVIIALIVWNIIKHSNSSKKVVRSNGFEIQNSNNEIKRDLLEADLKFELLASNEQIDENKLVEIKNSKAISKLIEEVPNGAKVLEESKSAIEAGKEAKNLYKVIIPKGATLMDSKKVEGAKRASYTVMGSNKIKGNANLKPVEEKMKELQKAQATIAVMNAASMVVGEYYMAQINESLDVIKEEIDKVSNFQESEYAGKVNDLVLRVQMLTEFKNDILTNEETRLRECKNLDEDETRCRELVGQKIKQISDKLQTKEKKYQDYSKLTKDIEQELSVLSILLDVLENIDNLRYTLGLGQMSKDYYYKQYDNYMDTVNDLFNTIKTWHYDEAKVLKIDLDNVRRKRNAMVSWIPKLEYKDLPEEDFVKIDKQISLSTEDIKGKKDQTDYYNEDAEIIMKDGKIYYLPQ